ncbi:MAG: hypothetical protein WKG06_44670 [Segetibacter sp.]
MKKLLTYLILIACFESFISSTSSYYCRHKNLSNSTNINISAKDETLQQDNIENEIHPLEIFSLRYF